MRIELKTELGKIKKEKRDKINFRYNMYYPIHETCISGYFFLCLNIKKKKNNLKSQTVSLCCHRKTTTALTFFFFSLNHLWL